MGPSDNIPFTLGVGDSLRPGTLYWSKGNNLDSSPDTNQQDLTDPSEALVNGVLVGGKSLVFTISRAIAVVPNFFNALATATGTTGSTWSVRTTPINRGLFYPRCLCVSGGGNVYFSVDDGIHVSPGGLAWSQSPTKRCTRYSRMKGLSRSRLCGMASRSSARWDAASQA